MDHQEAERQLKEAVAVLVRHSQDWPPDAIAMAIRTMVADALKSELGADYGSDMTAHYVKSRKA